MEDVEIIFTVRINDGTINNGKEVEIKTNLEELEIQNLPDLLINEGHIKYWTNHNEYIVIGRRIKLSR